MKLLMVYLENALHAFTKSIIPLLLILFICCYGGRTEWQITNLQCVNDYDSEMVCSWETVDFQTNCSTKYQLFYERAKADLESSSCIPENAKVDGSVLMNKCACTIYVPRFYFGDYYRIEIKSNGLLLHKEVIQPSINIKPKTPGNLTVNLTKNGDYILRWDKKYRSDDFIYDHLSFEIYCYNKHDPSENFNFLSNKKEAFFEINQSQLKLGSEYVARIRTRVTDNSDYGGYDGYWSDFSREVQWCNDRTNDSFKPRLFFICFLIIPLVIICYWGIRIIKKKNWDMIPDPSKSNILFTMISKSEVSDNLHSYHKKSSVEKRSCPLKITCSNWLAKFSPGLMDRVCARNHVPNTEGSQTSNCSPKMFESKFCKNQDEKNLRQNPNILIPECIIVEHFKILGKPDNIEMDEERSNGEDKQESDTADVVFCNSSINAMFHELLGISLSPLENLLMVRDEHTICDSSEEDTALQLKPNTHSPVVFSFFSETNQPSKDEVSCDHTLYRPKQSTESCDSGYRSFKSEVGHVEPKIYADTMSVHEAQSLPANQNRNCHIEEFANTSELGCDSKYHSFSSAVYQCENQTGESGESHGAWPATLFANSPFVYNTDQAQDSDTNLQFQKYEVESDFQGVYPQNAIKHDFPFWEGEQDLSFLPNRELLAEITQLDVSSVSSKLDLASLFDPSGYQSFQNAVEQEKTANADEAGLFIVDMFS